MARRRTSARSRCSSSMLSTRWIFPKPVSCSNPFLGLFLGVYVLLDGVAGVLDAIVERVPPPAGELDAPARALVFDSSYDQYRGVVAFVRVVDGSFSSREALRTMAADIRFDAEELGVFSPAMTPVERLTAGEVGYVVTGLKDVSRLRVGDTLTSVRRPAVEALPGYKDVKPMVFAGLFPTDSDDYPELRDALERLKLNDAALMYEPRRRRPRLRLPLRLPRACSTWRSSASGSSASSTSTSS